MFQDVYDDLPLMSTEVLALRRQLWDSEGQHLIFNVPYYGEGVTRAGPVSPYAGLCVAFLLLLRKDKQMFAPQIGDRPHAYQIGWGHASEGYGLFSITNLGGTVWTGYKDTSHPGFSAGYYYVYFYFEDAKTLHGFINNMDLAYPSAQPYYVDYATSNILFGQSGWHEVETLEVHWVAWGSPFNRGALPSQSIKDKAFQRNRWGEYHYEPPDIFFLRTGAVITVTVKYEANTYSNRRVEPDVGIHFGVSQHTALYADANFPEFKDTPNVYTFRINIMHRNAVIFHEGTTKIMAPGAPESSTEAFYYFMMSNVHPVRVFVETMGYRHI